MTIIKAALSAARMSTYEAATSTAGAEALELYVWNARMSAAFLGPLHICEVVLRNCAANAIEAVYGPRWPWSPGFETSLPHPQAGYSPKFDLQIVRHKHSVTGGVISDLKFAFWQQLFTRRHDHRIWNNHLFQVMPGSQAGCEVRSIVKAVYADLETIRRLRNRIAHHEPIFHRDLAREFDLIAALIGQTCPTTAGWMRYHYETDIRTLLSTRP
ncbi:hypothetical protein [Azorhizobium oxalatiphilum]|nr:hypothetical protein [Azorhizobium oxalatiphilum]